MAWYECIHKHFTFYTCKLTCSSVKHIVSLFKSYMEFCVLESYTIKSDWIITSVRWLLYLKVIFFRCKQSWWMLSISHWFTFLFIFKAGFGQLYNWVFRGKNQSRLLRKWIKKIAKTVHFVLSGWNVSSGTLFA